MAGHAVQHPTRRRNQAIATFFLYARQARQKFVGDIFPQAHFAKFCAVDFKDLCAQYRCTGRGSTVGPLQLKPHETCFVDFAQIVIKTRDINPVALRINHPPPGKVIQGRAPQHGFFAASVHGDIAAHTRRIRGGGVDGKDQAVFICNIGHAARDNTRTRSDRRDRSRHPRQWPDFDRAKRIELFSVDDSRPPGQRNRTAGIPRATSARHDREA